MYEAFAAPMRHLTDPKRVPDAFNAEVMVSVLAGLVLQAGLGGDSLATALLDVVDELARGEPAHAYPALRTLAVVGPPETAGYATRAADRVADAAERAGGSPAWVGQLGRVTAGACEVLTDAYGETQTLLCEFAYAGGARPHAVVAALDSTWHGSVVALTVADEPAQARRQLARQARRDGSAVREVPAREAGLRLLAGIEAFLRHGHPPGEDGRTDASDDPRACIGVARQRAGVLAGGNGQPTPADDDSAAPAASDATPGVAGDMPGDGWPQEARQRVAEEFLASRYGQGLHGPIASKLPLLMITTCVSQLGCDPLRVGPVLLERVLLQVFPRTLTAPDRYAHEIPPFLRAWAGWIADRQDMPVRRRKQLLLRLEFLLNRFPALWADQDLNPLRRYVQDLPDEVAADGDAMLPVLKRRTFAVPPPAERGDGLVQVPGSDRPVRRAAELDAADPVDRQLVTVLRLSSRGLPQGSFAPYTAVTEQLWTGEPPEAWAAAERIYAAGQTRDAVLDRLARTWHATAGGEGYAAALARLAARRR